MEHTHTHTHVGHAPLDVQADEKIVVRVNDESTRAAPVDDAGSSARTVRRGAQAGNPVFDVPLLSENPPRLCDVCVCVCV